MRYLAGRHAEIGFPEAVEIQAISRHSLADGEVVAVSVDMVDRFDSDALHAEVLVEEQGAIVDLLQVVRNREYRARRSLERDGNGPRREQLLFAFRSFVPSHDDDAVGFHCSAFGGCAQQLRCSIEGSHGDGLGGSVVRVVAVRLIHVDGGCRGLNVDRFGVRNRRLVMRDVRHLVVGPIVRPVRHLALRRARFLLADPLIAGGQRGLQEGRVLV